MSQRYCARVWVRAWNPTVSVQTLSPCAFLTSQWNHHHHHSESFLAGKSAWLGGSQDSSVWKSPSVIFPMVIAGPLCKLSEKSVKCGVINRWEKKLETTFWGQVFTRGHAGKLIWKKLKGSSLTQENVLDPYCGSICYEIDLWRCQKCVYMELDALPCLHIHQGVHVYYTYINKKY